MPAYVPILALQKNKLLQSTRVNEWGDIILLYLRGYEEDAQQIMYFYCPRATIGHSKECGS
jgi:hypothetical protein